MADLDVTQFIKDTRIDPVDLDDAFIKQSSIRAYWGAIAAEAEAKAARAKMARDSKEALVSKKYRDEAAVTGAKLTEKALDSMVKLDPEYIKACHLSMQTCRQISPAALWLHLLTAKTCLFRAAPIGVTKLKGRCE